MDKLVRLLYEELYSAYFSGGVLSANSFSRERGVDRLELRKLIASLEGEGYITTEGPGVSLTASGVLYCENNGVGADNRKDYNDLRYRIIKFLESKYDESGPRGGSNLEWTGSRPTGR